MMEQLVEAIVVCLLGATIFYCVKLNKRIQNLREHNLEMASLFQQFTQAIGTAQTTIQELRAHSTAEQQSLQAVVQKGQQTCDELELLINQGKNQLKQWQSVHSTARQPVTDMRSPAQASTVTPVSVEEMIQRAASRAQENTEPSQESPPRSRSRAEEELLQAIKHNEHTGD